VARTSAVAKKVVLDHGTLHACIAIPPLLYIFQRLDINYFPPAAAIRLLGSDCMRLAQSRCASKVRFRRIG